MSQIVIARSALPTFLEALLLDSGTPVDGPLFEAVLGLYQNDFSPVGTMVLADMDVATYDGYATQVIDPWTGPIINADGFAQVYGPALFFTPTGGTTPNMIYGYFVRQGAAGQLLYARRFDTPILLDGVLTGFSMTPTFQMGSQF